MFDRFWQKLKFDWWEITNLGAIGYVYFFIDWVKYHIGISAYKPDMFAYSEIDMDLEIEVDKAKDEKNV